MDDAPAETAGDPGRLFDRRQVLSGIAASGFIGLSGCVGGPDSERSSTATSRFTPFAAGLLVKHGNPPKLCAQEIVELNIIAIAEPAFAADWQGVEIADKYGELTPESAVVGVVRNGTARAYPVAVLWHHEIVNDDHGGPLLVTYCPLCKSGMVAERLVGGEPTLFGVSGQLWRAPRLYAQAAAENDTTFGVTRRNGSDSVEVTNNGNLVLYDAATGSYWSQLLARGLCGRHRGDTLPIVAAETASWSDWQRRHPDTEVLLPPPHSRAENPPYPLDGPPGTPDPPVD